MTRRRVQWTVGLVALAMACTVGPGLAFAADDQPPVAAPDEVTLLPGGSAYVDVMANDSDDLDQQALCRVRGNAYVSSGMDRGQIYVDVDTDRPDDYQVQYQACDYDYLSVGTVTVHAVPPQDLVVDQDADQPSLLHVTNPNPVRVLFYWGGLHQQRADGHFYLRAGASKDFTAVRKHIFWIALDPSSHWEDGSIVSYGEIRGIDLPTARQAPSSRTPRWADRVRLQAADRAGAARAQAAAGWPADPTTVEPPTPSPDTIDWWSGSFDRVNVLRNDTDPAGQALDVCRLSPEATVPSLASKLTPYPVDGRLYLSIARKADGTFLLPYYVCNSGRLAPTVLRVDVRRAEPLRVRRLASNPGVVRVRNPNPDRAHVEIGRHSLIDIIGTVPAHGSKTFRVSLRDTTWRGDIGPHHGYAGHGRIPQP